mgnify:CR=1 FL=1
MTTPLTTAMIFAAGLGTRMRPITNTIPKPLVKVGGKTLLDHVLDECAQSGITRAVVNVHYLPDHIEAHLKTRISPQIIISDERALLLDQGGGIKKAATHLDDAFFVSNTDAFWIEGPQSNIARLRAFWDPQKMDALLLVASTSTSIGVDWSGDFHMDTDGRLTKRQENEVAAFVYSGFGILKREPFAQDEREVFRLAPYLFEAAEKGRLFGLRLDGLWLHVGTPQAIEEAERALERSAI